MLLVFAMLFVKGTVIAVAGDDTALGSPSGGTAEYPCDTIPSYIKVIEEGADSLFMLGTERYGNIALEVIFKVNKTYILPDNPAYRRLISEAVPLIKKNNMKFQYMEVRGGASPEGPYWNNVRLSVGRAQALIDSLARYVDIPKDYVVKETVAEDYPYLVQLMAEAGDPDAEIVRAIVERYAHNRPELRDAAIKAALQQTRGGALWNRIYRTYYPKLRAARVVFYFSMPKVRMASIEDRTFAEDYPAAPVPRIVYPLLKEPVLSVKTNLLYDAFFVPGWSWTPVLNVALEWYPRHSRWTVEAEYTFPWWDRDHTHHYLQLLDWHLEARRYFVRASHHTGWYTAPYAHYNLYDFSFDAERAWQGEGLGWGLGLGYTTYFDNSRRWKMDCFLRVGYYESRYDPYHAGDPYKGKYYYDWEGMPEDFIRRNHRLRWLGPTGVGISVSYDFLYRPQRKGMRMSFKDYFTP